MRDSIAPLIDRLDTVESRLAALSRMPFPPGRTDPVPDAEETWDAARVWAHVAEFVGYWTAQAQAIMASPIGAVPPFGRVATDQGRIDAIERDHELPREQLWSRVHAKIEEAKTWFGSLSETDLDREGQHPARGPVPVRLILDLFVVRHAEEHANQLDKLADFTQTGRA